MEKMIGIIVATDEEEAAIKETIKKDNIVIVKSGVGKVNAARTTQKLIDDYDIEYIINTGSAGALNPWLNIGDIVVGKNLVQHDFDITAFGHPKGYISGVGRQVEADDKLVSKCKDVLIGIIASGDVFCVSEKMKDDIRAEFDADCVEMEGAAIAQVCKLSDIPFIVIRSISDTPNGNNQMDYNEYAKLASKKCAEFIKKLLEDSYECN